MMSATCSWDAPCASGLRIHEGHCREILWARGGDPGKILARGRPDYSTAALFRSSNDQRQREPPQSTSRPSSAPGELTSGELPGSESDGKTCPGAIRSWTKTELTPKLAHERRNHPHSKAWPYLVKRKPRRQTGAAVTNGQVVQIVAHVVFDVDGFAAVLGRVRDQFVDQQADRLNCCGGNITVIPTDANWLAEHRPEVLTEPAKERDAGRYISAFGGEMTVDLRDSGDTVGSHL